MAGWPRVGRRSLRWPEPEASGDDAAMVGGGSEPKRVQPAYSWDVEQLPRRALHTS